MRIGKYVSGESLPVFFLLVCFSVATGVLFFRVDRGLNPDFRKNWWTLSFETRDSGSSQFIIENHSSATRFTYTISHDKDTISNGELTVAQGGHETVSPPVVLLSGRTIVTVTADDGTRKEIYRER